MLQAEIFKLKKSRILFILFLTLVFMSFALSYWFQSYTGIEMLKFVYEIQLMFPLIIFMGIIGAYYITNEYQTGGFKRYISYGHRRSIIILTKSFVFSVLIIIMSSIMPLFTVLTNTYLNGFGDVSFLTVIRIILLSEFIYIGLTAMAVLVCLILKNPIITMGLFYAIYNVYVFFQVIASKIDFVKKIYDYTIFGQVQLALLTEISMNDTIQIIIVTSLTATFSIGLSIFVFRRMSVM
ncbi:ABC transporter permease [Bacillus changyiensis]|uniref:ABC transporter permease n=1 Tax=Bacillus changyiensis TaxID=3004103 RepID=UPI0022E04379|nr:ABC transporter permease [Bacillus changyiensis]MDA1476948.1 ABC transporter permease [Bacillus changyiensis]